MMGQDLTSDFIGSDDDPNANSSGENAMKKLLLGTVGLAALGMVTPASAADLAARPYTKAPPPIMAPIYDWTGFYIGGNGGWGESHSCVDFFNATGIDFADGCRSRSGGLIGGQLGYRWQASQWVFGLEAQGDWADLSNTRLSIINPLFSTRTKTDGIGLFTGQIGYAWNASLFYFKGGAAVTDNRFSILSTLTGTELAAASATRWGGTVGVGWEYGFAPNWSAGIEYDHLFMGNSNNSFSVVNPINAAFLNDRISQDVDMVTLRINYRFGGYGAPIVSKY
jgi:outer membrane immunogenic protein